MTAQPLTDEQLAAIRAQFERTTHPDWRDVSDTGRLLAEVDRLRAERDTARAQVAAARAFADEMGSYFVAAEYAQRLRDRLDNAADHR